MPVQLNGKDILSGFSDVEEGVWTFTITFATAGNLSVVYSQQTGTYTKIGRQVTISGVIQTSTFTHTTASGDLQILGMPFTPLTLSPHRWTSTIEYQGITKTGYEHITTKIDGNSTTLRVDASQEGANNVAVVAADMPTAGTVILRFTTSYEV